MNTIPIHTIKSYSETLKSWMEYMHQFPELAMNETETSKFIVEKLREIGGWQITEGVGKTGVVASMKLGNSKKSIGIRADFDALPIVETNNLSYKSKNEGKSHLCGHDGHTTMLLGAAKYLSETKNFNGTVHLIFQPGEETMEGGVAMIKDGLFERFPMDAVYAMHNIPGLPVGKFHFRSGPTMSAVDNWEIELTGKGGHGSMPELAIDPLVCGASLVMALQTVVSRNVSPWKQTVVNVGAFQSGNAGNVVPQTALLKISIRNMDNEVRKMVLDKIRNIIESQATSFGCTFEIRKGVPGTVLVNTKENTDWACEVAKKTFGKDNVIENTNPIMSSEDFAFMLEQKPGCYCMLGNGEGFMVHHPKYVFNQDILPIGATFWVALVEEYLK